MTIQAERVKRFLKMRQVMTTPALIKHYTTLVFDLALEDKEAAIVLFSSPNRLVQSISSIIEESKLMAFSRIHPELLGSLVAYGQLRSEVTSRLYIEAVTHILTTKNPEEGPDAVRRLTTTLFELALLNKGAATLWLSKPNRFALMLPIALSKEMIAKLPKVHPELFEQLVEYAGLSPAYVLEIQKLLRGAGRTRRAIDFNSHIQQHGGVDGIYYQDTFIPMITRKTYNFSDTALCSAGEGASREIIILNPQLPEYDELYQQLAKQIRVGSSVREILAVVKNETRRLFPKHEPDELVSKRLAQGNVAIPLLEFIGEGQGLCRHHALLVCYFVSRLLKEGLLVGDVIQHRQNLDLENAHTWVLFCNRSDSRVYSLDSLWDNVTCITDNPGELDRLYSRGLKVPMQVEAEIKRMHFTEEEQPAPYKKEFATAFFKRATPSDEELRSEQELGMN